jgi:hypothetical protein
VSEFERLEAAYAALDGSGGDGVGDVRSAGAGTRARGGGSRRARADAVSRRSGSRAKRGPNKAAVHGVIADRPGVTVTEIAQVTGIAKPLVYNTTRAGVERGELEKVVLPGGQQGFKIAQGAPASEPERSRP